MSLTDVDWSKIPPPADDGGAAHLSGRTLPALSLPSTSGAPVDMGALRGVSVLYLYPMTGRPDRALPEGWDMIPGARGCTPQSCAYRDRYAELRALGVDQLYGISAQDTVYQSEAADRLHLPFPLLSDAGGHLRAALDLPTQEVEGMILLRRLTMILRDRAIVKVFYPVFPPDQDAEDVRRWLETNA